MIRTLAVTSVLALAAAAAPAAAQLPLRLGVSAGASVPTGDFKSSSSNGGGAKTGYNVGLLAEVKPPLFPIGIRGDVIYNEFGLEDETGSDIGGANFRVFNANANAVLEMPGVMIHPYALGGIGWYHGYFSGDNVTDNNAKNAVGFNVGAGVKFGLAGFGAAVEAHYRRATLDYTDEAGGKLKMSYVPVSFVLTF